MPAWQQAPPRKGVALGHVDGAIQVGGDVVGRILRTGNVHDHLGLKVAWKRVRLADINDQMVVALVFDRRRQQIKAHDLVALIQKSAARTRLRYRPKRP